MAKYVAKSGCTLHRKYTEKKGLWIYGWKVIDGVMCKIVVFMSQKNYDSGEHSSPKANWVNCIVKILKPAHAPLLVSAMLDISNHNVYIGDWNWIISPKAKNGGYIGQLSKKK